MWEARGRWTEAADTYATLLDRFPGDTGAMTALADIHRKRGDWKGVAELMRRGAAADPASAVLRFNLGTALEALGDTAGTVAAYREAAKLGSASAAANLGDLEWKRGNAGAARDLLLRGVELDPASVSANNNLGNVLIDLGEWERGEAALRVALRSRLARLDASGGKCATWTLHDTWGTERDAALGVTVTPADVLSGKPTVANAVEGVASTMYGRERPRGPAVGGDGLLNQYNLRFADKEVREREREKERVVRESFLYIQCSESTSHTEI